MSAQAHDPRLQSKLSCIPTPITELTLSAPFPNHAHQKQESSPLLLVTEPKQEICKIIEFSGRKYLLSSILSPPFYLYTGSHE